MQNRPPWQRRDFLRAVTLVGLGANQLAGSATWAADAPAPIGLGFSLYGMKPMSLTDALSTCAAIGYDNVELACMPDYHADPDTLDAAARRALRERLETLKLRLSALMENLKLLGPEAAHRDNLKRLAAVCQLARDVGGQHPPIVETVLGGRPAEWPDNRSQMIDRLGDWARVAAEHQITLVIKPHAKNSLHRPDDAVALLAELKSPWMKLAYDYSHYEVQGLDLEATMAAVVPQAAFVHVKDSRGTIDDFRFLLPGDGNVDYADYLRRLVRHGYRGDVVVEVSGQVSSQPGYNPRQAAQHCYDRLSPAFEVAGVPRRQAG